MSTGIGVGPPGLRRRDVFGAGMGIAALAGYGWWATGLRPFTASSFVAIVVPGIALVVASPKLRQPAPRVADWFRARRRFVRAHWSAGLWLWSALIATLVGWQLVNLFLSPRAEHPTLSSLLGVIEVHPVRLVLFVLWAALGWRLTRR